jgi:hypothetical protein
MATAKKREEAAVEAPAADAKASKPPEAYKIVHKAPVTDVFKLVQFVNGIGVLSNPVLAETRPEYFTFEDGKYLPKKGVVSIHDLATYFRTNGCEVVSISEAEAAKLHSANCHTIRKAADVAVIEARKKQEEAIKHEAKLGHPQTVEERTKAEREADEKAHKE